MAKKSPRKCGSCRMSGHTASMCQSVKSITLKWKKFTSFANFKTDQYHLKPAQKDTKVGGGILTVGKCQGWYSLESDAGVHYIGLVGKINAVKRKKSQSKNSFYERWLGHYSDSRRSWHDEGGFGTGNNGTWPENHMKKGELLSKNKYQLLISKVNNIALVCKNKATGKTAKANYIDPGIEQGNLITYVEQYMIHHYANNPESRKFSPDKRELVDSKGKKVNFQTDKGIFFNIANTSNIDQMPPNIRVIISPKSGVNRSHLCEFNDEKRTMGQYKKTYKNDSKKEEAKKPQAPKKKVAAATRKKNAEAKKKTEAAAKKKKARKISFNLPGINSKPLDGFKLKDGYKCRKVKGRRTYWTPTGRKSKQKNACKKS